MADDDTSLDFDDQAADALLKALKTAADNSRTASSYSIAEAQASTALKLAEAHAWLIRQHG